MTETWMQPRDVAAFACQWRAEVKAAQRLGRRVGEPALPRGALRGARRGRRVGASAHLDVRAACRTSRQWRTTQATSTSRPSRTSRASSGLRPRGCATGALQMSPDDVGAFDRVAGDLLGRARLRVARAARRVRGGSGARRTARVPRPGARPASGYGARRFGVVVTRPCADFFAACRPWRCSSARICGLRRACHAITIPFSVKK